jgi:nitrogen-specific signal transduction histidine kinase/CheY-like chemotaxis protein
MYKKFTEDKNIKIIIITQNNSKDILTAINMGINDFVFQPINNNLLVEKLNTITQSIRYKDIIEEKDKQIKKYLNFIEEKLTKIQNKTTENKSSNTNSNTNIEHENIAAIGSWKHDLVSNKLTWSNEIYNIFEIDSNIEPSYEKILTSIVPEDREKVNSIHKKTIVENSTFSSDFSITVKDGSQKFLTETCKTTFDKNNKAIYTIGTIQDISKYKKLYENLSKNEKIMVAQSKYATMGEILTMIMHQWRQPITTISMTANNLLVDIELEELEEENVKKSADTITKQTQHLSQTIDDFRSFFRNVKLPEDTSIKNVLDDTINIMIHSLTNSEIKVDFNIVNDVNIKTFKRELLQVFINIIKNAKDALVENRPSDRFIKIELTSTDDNIEILISDNAGGIPKDIIAKIFDAYFTTKDESTGTGLGLYMSKKIIEENLNGKLNVNNIDDGVCFSIILPKEI